MERYIVIHSHQITENIVSTAVMFAQVPKIDLNILQREVGGIVDRVVWQGHWTTGGIDCWVNDEGMYVHEVNPVLTQVNRAFGNSHEQLWGPGVVTGFDSEGNTIGLNDEQYDLVRSKLREAGWHV